MSEVKRSTMDSLKM